MNRMILWLTGIFLTSLWGCQGAHFYYQAVRGHFEILAARKPIANVIADPNTTSALREKLERVQAIRAFAESDLSLTAGGSYSQYADLKRSQALWSIFAAPEFSLEPKKWCYPVAGCAVYRGYFRQADAQSYASRLRQQAMDVYIASVPAYSTLGWFDDPVLNTFIHRDEMRLAAMIFHELAHQRLYIPGDTSFNESFAVVVESEGVRRWLNEGGGNGDLQRYRRRKLSRRQFVAMVGQARMKLQALYQQPDLSIEEMRRQKREVFDGLKAAFKARVRVDPHMGIYRLWFERPLNNAHLLAVGTYHDLQPHLQHLLVSVKWDMNRFYQACESLAEKSFEERRALLKAQISAAGTEADPSVSGRSLYKPPKSDCRKSGEE